MHKELHILGLLQSGPLTGYDLHRIVVAHGELFTDLKKGNVYYLLERLAARGALQVPAEAGARGPRGERLIYALTDQGRQRFDLLLREVVRTYEVAHSGVEVGMFFLPFLDPRDAIHLLQERREAVLTHRALIEREAGGRAPPPQPLAQEPLLCLIDAPLVWVEPALHRLESQVAPPTTAAPRWPGQP